MDTAEHTLARLLDALERSVDPARQAAGDALCARALRGERVPRLPLTLAYPLPADLPFTPYPHREVFDDPAKMLFNELVQAFGCSIAGHGRVGDDLPYTVRANFGTGVMASMVGARLEVVEDNPPWVHPLESLAECEKILDQDPLDFTRGWCPRVRQRLEWYHAALAPYPNLSQSVRVVLPDLQGPLDTAELLRGSELFLDLVERPAWCMRLLEHLATAQVGFARRLAPLVTDGPPGFCHQHATTLPGRILIRNDSAIMVSPAMYRDLIAPHDERVLRDLGGGGIHACGRLMHLADEFLRLPSVTAIDLGQAALNDLDVLHAKARAAQKSLIRVAVPEQELVTGRVCGRFATGVVLCHRAESATAAARIMAAYGESVRQNAATGGG